MTIVIVGIDVVIVVLPVARTSVVRRVDVNGVNLVSMRIGERLQSMEIFTVDHGVCRRVTSVVYPPGFQ